MRDVKLTMQYGPRRGLYLDPNIELIQPLLLLRIQLLRRGDLKSMRIEKSSDLGSSLDYYPIGSHNFVFEDTPISFQPYFLADEFWKSHLEPLKNGFILGGILLSLATRPYE
jgi:hypothetical protein